MSSLPNLAAEYAIYYKIVLEAGQIRLRLWEIAPDSQKNPYPYLYLVNYGFHHREEAEAFLREYLFLNGAFDVPERNLPPEGQVEILPFPTWN
ncbi:hypothetical protein [Leptolyngbya sp. PCC 6406]|uniref:hypothetical protein n=1 Tax=Leptolyngbya sp. PCC 6406 TaxID=1173264 RepID=UPI0002ACDE82|nr:hypothetical protein [Leptolyngbya sp. PCC 6406]